jgi:hypothetical protein
MIFFHYGRTNADGADESSESKSAELGRAAGSHVMERVRIVLPYLNVTCCLDVVADSGASLANAAPHFFPSAHRVSSFLLSLTRRRTPETHTTMSSNIAVRLDFVKVVSWV